MIMAALGIGKSSHPINVCGHQITWVIIDVLINVYFIQHQSIYEVIADVLLLRYI